MWLAVQRAQSCRLSRPPAPRVRRTSSATAPGPQAQSPPFAHPLAQRHSHPRTSAVPLHMALLRTAPPRTLALMKPSAATIEGTSAHLPIELPDKLRPKVLRSFFEAGATSSPVQQTGARTTQETRVIDSKPANHMPRFTLRARPATEACEVPAECRPLRLHGRGCPVRSSLLAQSEDMSFS